MVKQTVFQTTGGAGTAFEISDGTAAGNASVGAASTYNPLAGDNPLLVRAVIGDESAIADLVTFAANEYDGADFAPGQRNTLFTLSLLAGPSSGGGSNDIRLMSVLDGELAVPAAEDNPGFVTQGFRTAAVDQDGARVAIGAAASVVLAAGNADRVYFEVKNDSGAVVSISLGGAADANDFELPDGSSWFMQAPAIYTGQIQGFSTPGGNVNVLEY